MHDLKKSAGDKDQNATSIMMRYIQYPKPHSIFPNYPVQHKERLQGTTDERRSELCTKEAISSPYVEAGDALCTKDRHEAAGNCVGPG